MCSHCCNPRFVPSADRWCLPSSFLLGHTPSLLWKLFQRPLLNLAVPRPEHSYITSVPPLSLHYPPPNYVCVSNLHLLRFWNFCISKIFLHHLLWALLLLASQSRHGEHRPWGALAISMIILFKPHIGFCSLLLLPLPIPLLLLLLLLPGPSIAPIFTFDHSIRLDWSWMLLCFTHNKLFTHTYSHIPKALHLLPFCLGD